MNEHMTRVRVSVAINAILTAIEWEQAPKECFVSACQLHGVVPMVSIVGDSEPVAYNDISDPRRWVDSTRTVEFGCSKWQYLRTSIGYFRDHVWLSEWDEEGGDKMPDHLRLLLDAFGVVEPAAPEVHIPVPEEDEDGEYHLVHEGYLTGDAETIARYATLEEAELAVALKSEAFARNFPGGRGHSWKVMGQDQCPCGADVEQVCLTCQDVSGDEVATCRACCTNAQAGSPPCPPSVLRELALTKGHRVFVLSDGLL